MHTDRVTRGSVRVLHDTPDYSGYSLTDMPNGREAASTLARMMSSGNGKIGVRSHGGGGYQCRCCCTLVVEAVGRAVVVMLSWW